MRNPDFDKSIDSGSSHDVVRLPDSNDVKWRRFFLGYMILKLLLILPFFAEYLSQGNIQNYYVTTYLVDVRAHASTLFVYMVCMYPFLFLSSLVTDNLIFTFYKKNNMRVLAVVGAIFRLICWPIAFSSFITFLGLGMKLLGTMLVLASTSAVFLLIPWALSLKGTVKKVLYFAMATYSAITGVISIFVLSAENAHSKSDFVETFIIQVPWLIFPLIMIIITSTATIRAKRRSKPKKKYDKSAEALDLSDEVAIENCAFANCKNIRELNLSGSLSYIGNCAFARCYALRKITFDGTYSEWQRVTKGIYWNHLIDEYTVVCSDGEYTEYGSEDKFGNNRDFLKVLLLPIAKTVAIILVALIIVAVVCSKNIVVY